MGWATGSELAEADYQRFKKLDEDLEGIKSRLTEQYESKVLFIEGLRYHLGG